MSATRNYDTEAYWVNKMRARVNDIEFTRNYWADRVDDLKTAYHVKIGNFDAMNAKRERREGHYNG